MSNPPEVQPEMITRALEAFAHCPDLAVSIDIALGNFSYTNSINGDILFPSASVLKIAISTALESLSSLKKLNLSEKQDITEIRTSHSEQSILRALTHTDWLTIEELMRLMVSASDELSTRLLRSHISDEAVNQWLSNNGFAFTHLEALKDGVSVEGHTTAQEAKQLLSIAMDTTSNPITARALSNSIMNSRIPLGITGHDVKISHKTGSLQGIAHDVAALQTPAGSIRVAFLSKNQIDTVMTAIAMGICTNQILSICGVSTQSSISIVKDING